MLFCRTCGQCIHINEEPFLEIRNTYGWESMTVDPRTGDTMDYQDSDTHDSDHERYECQHCQGSDVDFDSEATIEEAEHLRDTYEKRQEERRAERQQIADTRRLQESMKDAEWDHAENLS